MCLVRVVTAAWRKFQNSESPTSHFREEGWPSDQENIAQHPLFARTGWCSDRWDKEHHPGGVHKEASRHFLGDAATPPRGEARRGIIVIESSSTYAMISRLCLTLSHSVSRCGVFFHSSQCCSR